MTAKQWIMLLGIAPIFGTTFLFYRVMAGIVSPLTAMEVRVTIASLALAVAMLAQGAPFMPMLRRWKLMTVIAAGSAAIPFCLYAYATRRVGAGMAGIFNSSGPVFAVLLAHLLGMERLRWNKMVGVVLGMIGVIVLIGLDALAGASWSDVFADAVCILGTIAYAIGTLYAGKAAGLHPTSVSFAACAFSAVLILPVMLIFEPPWSLPMPNGLAWSMMAASGLLSTALGNLFFYALMREAGSVNSILVLFLVPIWAVIYGAVFIGEGIDSHAWIGAGLIFIALAAIDGRAIAYLRGRLPTGRVPR